MYCELQDILDMPLMDDSTAPHQTIIDFWGKVTPGILQLLSHSKVVCIFMCLLGESIKGETAVVHLFLSDVRDGKPSFLELNGSFAGVQLNCTCEGS